MNVASGIHQLEHGFVDCYMIVDGNDISLVDTGLPTAWPHLVAVIRDIGRALEGVHAAVLSPAHFGLAHRLQNERRLPIWLHPENRYVAKYPYRFGHGCARLPYPLTFPRARPILASMTRAGALTVKGIRGKLDPYTGGRGRQIVAGAATADSHSALASLHALAETDARIVLPGCGHPWTAGIRPAVDVALTSEAR